LISSLLLSLSCEVVQLKPVRFIFRITFKIYYFCILLETSIFSYTEYCSCLISAMTEFILLDS
jgi:predicted membrane chloride channel (bestrophin family)